MISIHAAREGGDMPCNVEHESWKGFQSTPPVKAATFLQLISSGLLSFQSTPPVKAATHDCALDVASPAISIHAAREGGDCNLFFSQQRQSQFQSTPPVKAATP